MKSVGHRAQGAGVEPARQATRGPHGCVAHRGFATHTRSASPCTLWARGAEHSSGTLTAVHQRRSSRVIALGGTV